jgi:hypothetical protein
MQTYATNENYPTDGKSKDLASWALTFSLIVGVAAIAALGKAIYRGCTTSSEEKDAGLKRSLSANTDSSAPAGNFV